MNCLRRFEALAKSGKYDRGCAGNRDSRGGLRTLNVMAGGASINGEALLEDGGVPASSSVLTTEVLNKPSNVLKRKPLIKAQKLR